MSSKPAKQNGEITPALPVFSYAQAAKGRPAPSPATGIQLNQSSTSNTIVKETSSIADLPSHGSEKVSVYTSTADAAASTLDVSVDQTRPDTGSTVIEQMDFDPASPGIPSNMANLVNQEIKDEDSGLVTGASKSVRDRNLVSGQSSQKTDVPQGKKGRKSKAPEAEVEKQELKPEVFVPAPLPAVNYWQQRKEKLALSNPSTTPPQNSKISSNSSAPIETLSNSQGKTLEIKKRTKHQLGLENSERQLSASQIGGTREPPASNRPIRKGVESSQRTREEQSNRRNGPRSSRPSERDEKLGLSRAPPPVEDSISWPTPETVLEEDKRKLQEKLDREEKEENTSNKPRPKEKWVPVPYIPTVTFNTPMPIRGGRGRGGARGTRGDSIARTSHNHIASGSGDKSLPDNSNNSKSIAEIERQDAKDGGSSTSVLSGKKQLSDVTGARKSSNFQPTEKNRIGHSKTEISPQNDYPNAFSSGRSDQNLEQVRDSNSRRGENTPSYKQENSHAGETLKSTSIDRRSDPNSRNFDYLKDNVSSKENTHQTRERSDGRPERGRGAYRGRGSHSNYPNGQTHHQSGYVNGSSSQQQNGYSLRQATGPYSPPLAPLLNTQFAPPIRGTRNVLRSQSIPNSGMYGCFTQNGGSISQQFASLQTPAPMYDFAPMQPLSATTFQPYMEQVSLPAMVTMQLDYYFSIDNLCKDVFLRRHMDSQGYVFLSFIAGFKRIQGLTQDFELIRFACQDSEIIELIRGDDGIDRIRRKEGWEKWVLNMEERDESTKNHGPTIWDPSLRAQKPQFFGQMIMTSPDSLVSFSTTESNFRPCEKIAPSVPSLNGTDMYQPDTPLSAAVPEFAPSLPPSDSSMSLLEAETTFHDDEVSNLTLVFAPPKDNAPARSSFHTSRTFSNGSIDRKSVNEELHGDPHSIHSAAYESCDISPECLTHPSNLHSSLPSSRSPDCNGPPVMWVKGQKQQVPVSERNSQELYIVFRARALKNRELLSSEPSDVHPDMKLLYEFWSHFLCRNFNSRMYSEFRQFALEDAQVGSLNGMKNLISYYDEILNSKKKTIPEVLARHFVDLVNLETSDERPAFKRLRAAWRNGALDLKSRKKIDSLIDSKLREELERAPGQKVDLP